MPNIDFCADMQRIVFWSERMGRSLRHMKDITEPYMWCQHHLQTLADLLVDYYDFCPVRPTDNRMLFAVAPANPLRFSRRRGSSRMLDEGCIELPLDASSFFSPNRQRRWKEIFHSPLWEIYDRPAIPGASNTLMDLVNLLQCLLPGMFLLVDVRDGWSTQRGIPPCNWIRENKDILTSSIGIEHYNALIKATTTNPENSILTSRNTIGYSRFSP